MSQAITTPVRIGIIGSGFVSRGLVSLIAQNPQMTVARVLTRRKIATAKEYPFPEVLTNSVDQLINSSDVVVECSGDIIHATNVVDRVLNESIPVVTMNAELHVTTGSYLVSRGTLTEGEGDQPGSLATLYEEVQYMGFKPLVFGNVKWFQNNTPTLEEMQYWSERQGISLTQVTSFTDGTKLQIEQALIANYLKAGIVTDGLLGIKAESLEEGAQTLAEIADQQDHAISDYIQCRDAPPGVFIVGTHEDEQAPYLRYYKMGTGPYYTIVRPYHLCHLELPKTISRILAGKGPLLHNSEKPHISVAAVAKRPLSPGYIIERGIGGFDVRGIAVEWDDDPDHVPIGLISNVVVRNSIEPGQRLQLSDIEIPDSLALDAWRSIKRRVTLTEEIADDRRSS